MEKLEFRPFDKILVRDYKKTWIAEFFSHYDEYGYPRAVGNRRWQEIIPYKGNEKLLGTNHDYIKPYKPKDGEFITRDGDAQSSIFIYFETNNFRTYGCYAGLYKGRKELKTTISDNWLDSYCPVRPATETEKQELLNALYKAGKQWNPIKKCVENLYIPKDGEFVKAHFDCGYISIMIYKSPVYYRDLHGKDQVEEGRYEYYCSLNNNNRISYNSWGSIKYFTPTTIQEQHQLIDALHENNKDWDVYEKEIVELRWKPNTGDKYYYIFDDMSQKTAHWAGHVADDVRYEAGNCFHTEKEAQAMAEKFKTLLKHGRN